MNLLMKCLDGACYGVVLPEGHILDQSNKMINAMWTNEREGDRQCRETTCSGMSPYLTRPHMSVY